jgi:ABC-type multidrug transport system fused ATPase/permease subunit
MTAFVGPTGAGKSTLLDLIPRFYAPTGGRVVVDGVDLANVTSASWLSQIAIVSQENFLFNTSVRDNLLAGRPDASEADLIEALKAANVYEEIASLPEGLDTKLGDRGVSLSGGQRQRLAIARAFVKRAPILLLDEATSALDTETERRVQQALDRLIQGATVFAIAHRLSTIAHADQILVVESGEIVERGSHAELLAKNGRYAMLHSTQLAGARAGIDENIEGDNMEAKP